MKHLLFALLILVTFTGHTQDCNLTNFNANATTSGGIIVSFTPPSGAVSWQPFIQSPYQYPAGAETQLNPFVLTAWNGIVYNTTYTIDLSFFNSNSQFICKETFTLTTAPYSGSTVSPTPAPNMPQAPQPVVAPCCPNGKPYRACVNGVAKCYNITQYIQKLSHNGVPCNCP